MILPHRCSRLTGALLLLAAAGCARPGSPTGGGDDRRPPLVVSVEPDTFAVVRPGLDRLRVEFNERISERTAAGDLDAAVLISPEVGALEVDHGRSGLEIRIPGGLPAGRVYTVRVLPVIQDMFGNRMAVPFEWAISTGGEFNPNAVVGQVWDRTTGDFLPEVRVVLVSGEGTGGAAAPGDDESLPAYAALSGDEGLYALRLLPVGPFRVTAFQDRNGDRTLDPTEAVGTTTGSLGAADTLFLSLPILLPDSTAATLAQAETLDSTVVRLLFDDALDPTVDVGGIAVALAVDTAALAEDSLAAELDPDTLVLPEVARLFHEYRWIQFQDSARAAADSALGAAVEAARAAGDTARADSLAAAGPESVPGGNPGRAGGGRGAGGVPRPTSPGELLPDGTPMPQPSLVVLLSGPLPAGVPVLVTARGAVNLNGLPGGGGSAVTRWTPAPDSVAPDSLGIPLDTLAAPPDTGLILLPPRR